MGLKGVISTAALVLITTLNHQAQTLSNEIMNKIDSVFTQFQAPDPGASVMIIKNGIPVFTKGYGFADLESGIPVSPVTNYRLASVTKQFTAMCVMILAEKGKISIDDPLIKYFTDYPQWANNVKIIHLLNHTSGILDYESLIPDSQTIPVSDNDVYNSLRGTDSLYFGPGTKYQYSNSAYVLLGVLIEKLSGSSFSDFLKTEIFTPLGMDESSTNLIKAKISNRAFGYSGENGTFLKTDQSVTSYTLGDGGIYSSVSDLFKWDQALYGGKVVSNETMNKIFNPSSWINEQKNEAYGLGWFISQKNGRRCIWHSGNSRGFTNLITRFPDEKLTIIILTNRNEADVESVEKELEAVILKDI